MYTQTLQNFSVALQLRPPITRIHFGFSFHIQIYQSHWDLYNKALNYTETASGRPSFLRATRGERRVLLLWKK